MASAFSHAVVAGAIGTAFWQAGMPPRLWALGVLYSVAPDFDFIGFRLGIEYGDLLGHRGLTHSLAFAAAMAAIGVSAFVEHKWVAWWYLFLSMASHGVLDAMTDGGLGIAFFSPFSNARYFLPWRPIAVSPIGITEFFSQRGLEVLRSELKWIWLPSGVFAVLALAVNAFRTRRR
jgi:inner membrane protein